MMDIFYKPEGRLRLTLDDRSYLTVKPAWAAPLTYPGKYLSLVDGKGKQIMMLTEPQKELTADQWALVSNELNHRYLNGKVTRIHEAKEEFGATYWSVETDRGHKEFVTQSLQENAQWLGPRQLLIIDVDGNRFEIPDIDLLDPGSRKLLDRAV